MAQADSSLPDDLAAPGDGNRADLSAVAPDAVRPSLSARSTDLWLASLVVAVPRGPARAVSHHDALGALDAARDEAPDVDVVS